MDSDDLAHLVGNIEEIRYPLNTRFLFPSKVGGKPAWLVPESLPETKCDSCKKPMTFLLQLYAPDADNVSAFHRSLMVFCCVQCRCFLKCFRSQLPLENQYYPAESISVKDAPLSDPMIDTTCCDSCGIVKHVQGVCRPLPEYGIDIEEIDEIDMRDDEEEGSDEEDSDDEDLDDEGSSQALQACPSSDMAMDESEMDLFNEFTDTATEKDPAFRMFKKFVAEAPTQHVIYYSAGGSPIWITEENQMPGAAPKCEWCNGPRQFEFQIQPQLIYHLMKRLRGFPMNAAPFELGVVPIYTFAGNFAEVPAYKEEFVYNQLEPAEWLEFNSRKKVDFTEDKRSSSKAAPRVSRSSKSDDDDGEWM